MEATLPSIGARAFGLIRDYPPAMWGYDGFCCGAHRLVHLPKTSQSRPFPDQYVDRRTLNRLFGRDSR